MSTKKNYQQKPWTVFYGNNDTVSVMKYGGASLACSEDFRTLKEIVRKNNVRFLVVSAMSGITNKLEFVADLFLQGQLKEAWLHFETDFVKFHKNVCEGIGINPLEIETFKNSREFLEKAVTENRLGLTEDEFKNFVVSFGEMIAREIVMKYLNVRIQKKDQFHHVDAKSCIFIDDDGNVKHSTTSERLINKLYAFQGKRIIMEGFIAAEHKNLGRNGSDTSAALLAIALSELNVYPAVTFLKKEPFQSSLGLGKTVSYENFLSAMTPGKQPYVHPEAVRLLEKHNIVFSVVAKDNPNFELIVSDAVRSIPEMIRQKKEVLV